MKGNFQIFSKDICRIKKENCTWKPLKHQIFSSQGQKYYLYLSGKLEIAVFKEWYLFKK